MASNRKQGHKIIKTVRTEDASGLRMDAGPHIGVVKHVLDPTRSGRLQVFLPHLGGNPDNVNNLKIVQYASPFSGHTSYQSNPTVNTTFGFETVRHSYGMWFTPPDVGVRVLVIFAAGNPNDGYWIGCLPPVVEHNQLGSSGGAEVKKILYDAQVADLIKGYGAPYAPAVEINGANVQTIVNKDALDLPMPPHRVQTKILAEQGLLADPNRGIDDARSTRETPSGAFGITTPGRTYVDQATDDLLRRVTEDPNVDVTKIKEKVENGRKGGHQFIMDDGDVNGNQRRMKFRSAAGHQIIMDDTNGFMYISTATGKNWIELANDGQMFIYAGNDISIRTEADLNLKVGRNFNLEVDGDFNTKVRGDVKTEAINREEVLTGNKHVDITGNYDTTVAGTLSVDATGTISLNTAVDVAIEAGAAVGIKAGAAMNIDSADASGWKAGGDLNFEAPTINLNSGAPGAPASVNAPTVPAVFTLADLNDSIKDGDIWKHEASTDATGQTILPIIPTHEPYLSGTVTPLVSTTGQPSKKV